MSRQNDDGVPHFDRATGNASGEFDSEEAAEEAIAATRTPRAWWSVVHAETFNRTMRLPPPNGSAFDEEPPVMTPSHPTVHLTIDYDHVNALTDAPTLIDATEPITVYVVSGETVHVYVAPPGQSVVVGLDTGRANPVCQCGHTKAEHDSRECTHRCVPPWF